MAISLSIWEWTDVVSPCCHRGFLDSTNNEVTDRELWQVHLSFLCKQLHRRPTLGLGMHLVLLPLLADLPTEWFANSSLQVTTTRMIGTAEITLLWTGIVSQCNLLAEALEFPSCLGWGACMFLMHLIFPASNI